MIVIACEHETTVKCGKHASGSQRLRCKVCGKYLVEETAKPIGDMRISMKDAVMAWGLLLEGMSIRATERLTGLHRDTIDEPWVGGVRRFSSMIRKVVHCGHVRPDTHCRRSQQATPSIRPSAQTRCFN